MKYWTTDLLMVFLTAAPVLSGEIPPPGNIILMEQARVIALKELSGRIGYGKLQARDGKWIYSFEIFGVDKKIHEIDLDAHTGKVSGKYLEPLPMQRE